jgi:hypothetical protein
MQEQLVVISIPQLQSIIKSTISSELATLFQQQERHAEIKPVVYRTREYVKDLLHTSYVTLDKYTKTGVLRATYFGRKVLYKECDLDLDLPKVRALIDKRKKAA